MEFIERTRATPTVHSDKPQRHDTGRSGGVAIEQQRAILIVENDENTRHLYEHVLRTAGYGCHSVANGLEALNVLEREHADLVLLDLSMPVMDGFRAVELLRQLPHCSSVPVVAISAHASGEHRAAALQRGCTEYLTKPFRTHALLTVVARLFGMPSADR